MFPSADAPAASHSRWLESCSTPRCQRLLWPTLPLLGRPATLGRLATLGRQLSALEPNDARKPWAPADAMAPKLNRRSRKEFLGEDSGVLSRAIGGQEGEQARGLVSKRRATHAPTAMRPGHH